MLRPTVEWPSAFAREDGGGRQRSDPLRAWNLGRIAKGLRRWAAKRRQQAHILNSRPKTRALQIREDRQENAVQKRNFVRV